MGQLCGFSGSSGPVQSCAVTVLWTTLLSSRSNSGNRAILFIFSIWEEALLETGVDILEFMMYKGNGRKGFVIIVQAYE